MDDGDTGVFARRFDRLGRAVEVGVASGRAISVSFPESPAADAGSDHALLDRVGQYLDGERVDPAEAPVALTVPTDARRVLEAVRTVPHGESATVREVLRLAGMDPEEDEESAVRDALRGNPVPLFVPDHRVAGDAGATPAAVRGTLRAIEGLDPD